MSRGVSSNELQNRRYYDVTRWSLKFRNCIRRITSIYLALKQPKRTLNSFTLALKNGFNDKERIR